MTTNELRLKVHQIIENASEMELQAILLMLDNNSIFTDEQKDELKKISHQYKQGELKVYSVEETRKILNDNE